MGIFAELKTTDEEILSSIDYVQSDIKKAKETKTNPTRTPEEEQFYRHLVGIQSYIAETKMREPNYIFDNVTEVEGLLRRFEELKTTNEDIIFAMNYITAEIKKVLARNNGKETEAKYQDRLHSLGIISPEVINQDYTRHN